MVTLSSQPVHPDYIPKDFRSELKPIWCKGCGNFAVLSPVHKALAEVGVPPHLVAVISGIGCSSRIPGYCATYGFNSIHGRALPIASGVKICKPEMTVIVAGGDGDGLAIGGGHFPHAGRRNVDMTYIMMDNSIYGLTKGQASPSTPLGDLTKSTPYGTTESPLDAVSLALAYNVSFVARCFVGEGAHLVNTITEGIRHPGFAFIHVISPCPTYRGMDVFKQVKSQVEILGDDHDTMDKGEAYKMAIRGDGKISLGLFHKHIRPTMLDNVEHIEEEAHHRGDNSMETIFSQFMP
ncbi:MAG: 2-oxoacid:ferredoxin oxidoreductase subunit beta [Candidatus Hinthialibacter antarcticus]|nr:2-oxoacid:ferredoxin oxidoreductase subunit beta [Candidatus Hinthialibacter antarcticus]